MVIVGAGCAGLSCARTVHDAGQRVVVLDRSRGVGGRCATRRIDGQPVDHGLAFYHGSHPDFLEALDRVDSPARLDGWPERVIGDGKPCLPRAFVARERRLAFAEGVTAFPKSLARGIDWRPRTHVRSISVAGDRLELEIDGSAKLATQSLVLALPAEQMQALVEPLCGPEELEGARELLAMLTTDPCLTLIAGYPLEAPAPDWDLLYPTETDALVLAAHDSRKRKRKSFHAFVFQCSAQFSRRHLDEDPATWTREVLGHAATALGAWAGQPSFTQAHRWRFGRANGWPLTRPLLVRFSGGQRLGLAGELFDSALGVEGAFLAGRALAQRLLDDDG